MTTAFQPEIINLGAGDTIPVADLINNMFMVGIATDVTNPNKISLTMDAFSRQAVLSVPVLKGPPGDPGNDALSLHFVPKVIADLDQLPSNLGDTDADVGRFYVYAIDDDETGEAIATTIFIWTGVRDGPLSIYTGLGKGFIQIPVGTPGPDGAYADIQPYLVITETGNGMGPHDTDSWVVTSPNWWVEIDGVVTATSGQFMLRVVVNGTGFITAGINYNATALAVQNAIAALSNVGTGNVLVTGNNGGPYTISFVNALAQATTLVVSSPDVGDPITGPEEPYPLIVIEVDDAPVMVFNLAAPQGETGPCAALGSCFDVDMVTRPATPGDILVMTERLTPSAPTGLAATKSTTGGVLAAGTYTYAVTATVPNGETVASGTASVTATGSTSSVSLAWTAPTGNGSTGYNVYRTIGGVTHLIGVITSGAQVTFVDQGAAGIVVSPPTTGIPAGKNIWVNTPQEPTTPFLYTIPESAFVSSALGIEYESSQPTIGTFAMPPQAWPWIPFVHGECIVSGINISVTPLLVGAQVMVGAATVGSGGQQVAAGQSNSGGTIVMIPDFGNSTFITPTSGIGVVPANHTGNQGTLYVVLTNEGLAGLYDFHNTGAELTCLVVPIIPPTG